MLPYLKSKMLRDCNRMIRQAMLITVCVWLCKMRLMQVGHHHDAWHLRNGLAQFNAFPNAHIKDVDGLSWFFTSGLAEPICTLIGEIGDVPRMQGLIGELQVRLVAQNATLTSQVQIGTNGRRMTAVFLVAIQAIIYNKHWITSLYENRKDTNRSVAVYWNTW